MVFIYVYFSLFHSVATSVSDFCNDWTSFQLLLANKGEESKSLSVDFSSPRRVAGFGNEGLIMDEHF